MGEFETRSKRSKLWIILAILMALGGVFLLFSKLCLVGLVLLFFAGLIFLIGRRGQSAMRSYAIIDDRIAMEGTDMSIPFSEIVDVEARDAGRSTSVYIRGILSHNGNSYYANQNMNTNLLSLEARPQVWIYSNKRIAVPTIYGSPYNCYILTPKDTQAFAQELNEKLGKYRASHPPASPPTQTPP